jgi:hypothetical protein
MTPWKGRSEQTGRPLNTGLRSARHIAVQRSAIQALERYPSKACAKKMPALTRPIIAVTVSIIANVPCTPPGSKRLRPCTVKRNSLYSGNSERSDARVQQLDRPAGPRHAPKALWQPSIYHYGFHPISAAFGLRYPMCVRRWAAQGASYNRMP